MQPVPRENDTRQESSNIKPGTTYTFYDLKEAASLTGVPRRTIQYWLQKGLFVPSAHYSTGPGDPHLLTYSDLEKITILDAVRHMGIPQKAREKRQIQKRPFAALLSVSRWMKSHGVPRKEMLVAGKELIENVDTVDKLFDILEREGLANVQVVVILPLVLQELEARISIPEE